MVVLDPMVNVFLTSEEATEAVAAWAASPNVHTVLLRSRPLTQPFACVPFRPGAPGQLEAFEQAWVDTVPFDPTAENSTKLAMANRESLRFRFPELNGDRLIEGTIGSVAHPRSPRGQLWASLVGPLLSGMVRGMWVYNSGTKRLFRADRYYCSSGAKAAHAAGIQLVASSGYDLFFPERPEHIADALSKGEQED
jgi:hypothetical protein